MIYVADVPRPAYTVKVRDRSRTVVAQASYARDLVSLEAVLNFNDQGTWRMVLPADSPLVPLLETGCGIVIEQDDTPVFSGDWDQLAAEYSADGDSAEYQGIDDTGLLADRDIRPSNLPLDGAGHWPYPATGVADTVAETALHTFVSFQVGPTARADLRIPGLVLGTDSGRGTPVTTLSRLDVLVDVLRDLAGRGGGLGFRCVQAGAAIQFQTYMPRDRTGLVTFSLANGTLVRATVTTRAPGANSVIAGGKGEAEQRVFAERADTAQVAAWQRVIDLFTDQRDTELAALSGPISDELVAGAGGTDVALETADNDAVRYGRDYGLGDRVRVKAGPYDITGIVSSVKLALAADGWRVTPTVTTTGIAETGRRSSGGGRALQRLAANTEGFTPGMVMLWARSVASIPSPWQLADGTNGTPDLRNRWVVGAGNTYSLLQTLGNTGLGAIALGHDHTGAPHTHQHSHSGAPHTHAHDHTGPAHTHPGHHSHGINDHSHGLPAHPHTINDHSHTINDHNHLVPDHNHPIPNHNHLVDLDHNHLSQTFGSLGVAEAGGPGSVALDTTVNLTHGGTDKVAREFHTHNTAVDLQALGTNKVGSENQSSGGSATSNKTGLATQTQSSGGSATNDKTGMVTNNNTAGLVSGDKTGMVTNDDTAVAPGATYTGNTGSDSSPAAYSGSTGNDSTGAAYTANTGAALSTLDLRPPSTALYYIYRL